MQQILLVLANRDANTGAVILLDEPDGYLEILGQRQIYDLTTEVASFSGNQVIAACHSEVLRTEAAARDLFIAFVGTSHRIRPGNPGSKALAEIEFDQYYQDEETGWVLYL